MTTYKRIQNYIKTQHQRTVKSCWIAHAKELLALPVKRSPHRLEGQPRVYPCPDDVFPLIRDALKHFGDL